MTGPMTTKSSKEKQTGQTAASSRKQGGQPSLAGPQTDIMTLQNAAAMIEEVLPGGKRRVRTERARDTDGRPDPLGSESGPILEEDLNFLFEEFDVYEAENSREMREARLQTEGMSHNRIVAEIHRLEEIVKSGQDRRSLIPIREDFNDQMIRSAEDL